MLYRTILLFFLVSHMLVAQPCSNLVGTTTDGNGTPIYAFNTAIEFSARHKKQISIYGCIIDSAIIVIFRVAGTEVCIQQGTAIHATFTDGTKLELKNLHPYNCDQKSVIGFSKELNNLPHFDILKNKQIAGLKIWTSSSESVKTDLPAEAALKLSESLKCLSNYIGRKPPPEMSVSGSGNRNRSIDLADTTKQFVVVEQQPEFEGGYVALMQFIRDHLRTPASAMKDNVYGTVMVTFIIDRDGSVKEAAILQGVREDLNKEALRVVNLMPPWKPGRQHGKPVIVRFNIPINFRP